MAKLKPIRIDDQTVTVDESAPLARLVPADVQSVRTLDGALITRDQFARIPIPEGFETNLSAINKGGAPKPDSRTVIIDGAIREVPQCAPLAAVVPTEVATVRTDEGALITRDQFARVPIPQGFETNLSAINKGGAPLETERATAWHMPRNDREHITPWRSLHVRLAARISVDCQCDRGGWIPKAPAGDRRGVAGRVACHRAFPRVRTVAFRRIADR